MRRDGAEWQSHPGAPGRKQYLGASRDGLRRPVEGRSVVDVVGLLQDSG